MPIHISAQHIANRISPQRLLKKGQAAKKAAMPFLRSNWVEAKGIITQTVILSSLWQIALDCPDNSTGYPLFAAAAISTFVSLPFHRILMLKDFGKKLAHNYQVVDFGKISASNIPTVGNHESMAKLDFDAAVFSPFRLIFLGLFKSDFAKRISIAHEAAHIEYNASEYLADKAEKRVFNSLSLRSKLAFLKASPLEFLTHAARFYFPTLGINLAALHYLLEEKINYHAPHSHQWINVPDEQIPDIVHMAMLHAKALSNIS
ncbi:MAG: hypothetical protein HQ596_05435 [Candidatus Saganbacteria bacterium]|nr:hypothetical protein [Candidatus Saganbacteria bacterium]